MSDHEHFLTRWSRRKREPDAPAETEALPGVDEQLPPEQRQAAADPAPAGKEPRPPRVPEFDLTQLPALDSIEAGTDITGFLKPGVPPELTRAALRRAWVADPAVRDFVGLSENSWDFTNGSIPGFGAISPEDVARIVARMGLFASPEPVEAEPAPEPPALTSDTSPAAPAPAPTPPAPTQLAFNDRTTASDDSADPAAGAPEPADEKPPEPVTPRHGRALPR
jgi:hypothetical protein